MDKFLALSDPTRRQIIELLCVQELSAGDIAQQFRSSPPAISQHLKILREAGILVVRNQAQKRFYSMNQDGLAEVSLWIKKVSSFWSERLDNLERELKSTRE